MSIKRKANSSSHGFTLVELLVVITIIGLLITVTLVILSNAKARSRDSRRVADIDVLRKAMALYLSVNDQYPPGDPPGVVLNGEVGDTVTPLLKSSNIIGADMPDPLDGHSAPGGGTFHYTYQSTDTTNTYSIDFCLETSSIAGYNQGCGNSVGP